MLQYYNISLKTYINIFFFKLFNFCIKGLLKQHLKGQIFFFFGFSIFGSYRVNTGTPCHSPTCYFSPPPACVPCFILYIALPLYIFASVVSGVAFALMCLIAPSHFIISSLFRLVTLENSPAITPELLRIFPNMSALLGELAVCLCVCLHVCNVSCVYTRAVTIHHLTI